MAKVYNVPLTAEQIGDLLSAIASHQCKPAVLARMDVLETILCNTKHNTIPTEV
jgi:hypothetical protein